MLLEKEVRAYILFFIFFYSLYLYEDVCIIVNLYCLSAVGSVIQLFYSSYALSFYSSVSSHHSFLSAIFFFFIVFIQLPIESLARI